ncbi:MAG: hypothetical protein U5K43_04500 [Halofilum sp. (in: g-proteobacteria)]|nr:hypothetical protein [Halofilum sp. (in: g-proteobacteria)]
MGRSHAAYTVYDGRVETTEVDLRPIPRASNPTTTNSLADRRLRWRASSARRLAELQAGRRQLVPVLARAPAARGDEGAVGSILDTNPNYRYGLSVINWMMTCSSRCRASTRPTSAAITPTCSTA